MRLVTICICLVSVLMLTYSGFVLADTQSTSPMPDRLVEFYNRHIDMKIAAAELHASMGESGNREAQCLAQRGKEEAAFYKSRREELIKEMAEEGVGMKAYKVHYFLTNAFLRSNPEAKSMC